MDVYIENQLVLSWLPAVMIVLPAAANPQVTRGWKLSYPETVL